MRRAALILLPFILTSALSAANLVVRVKDKNNYPLRGAMIAVIAYPQTGGTVQGAPSSLNSDFQLSSSSGIAVFGILAGYDYQIYASSQGFSPTIKDQMYSPAFAPVRTTGNDLFVERTISPDASLAEGTGSIEITATSPFCVGQAFFSDVRNVTTDEPVAFSMSKMTNGGLSVRIPNIPAAGANTYRVSVGIPEKQLTYETVITTVIVPGKTVSMAVSSSTFFLAGLVDNQNQPAGNVSFEGTVYAFNSGLKDCVVTLTQKSPDAKGENDWMNSTEYAETRTDAGGHFVFYDVSPSSYSIQIARSGFEGYWNSGNMGWGLQPGRDRYIRGTDGSDKIMLDIATGTVHGHVYMWKGLVRSPVPGAYVNLCSDNSIWPALTADRATSEGGGYNNYYTTGSYHRGARTNASVRTQADGSFWASGLGHGNYVINVWSQMTSNQYVYNGFNPGSWDTRLANDLRVTVSSVTWRSTVYCGAGAIMVDPGDDIDMFIASCSTSTQPAKITGTITFDVPENTVNISSAEPVTIWAHEQNNGGFSRIFFTTLSGMLSRNTTYQIDVATGTYWIEVDSRKWGLVGSRDSNVSIPSPGTPVIMNFKLIPGGIIKGVVRLPDGKLFKSKSDNNVYEYIRISAAGTDVSGSGYGEVREDGQFELKTLMPGTYNLVTQGGRQINSGSGRITLPLEWPNGEVNDVKVRTNAETYVEIQLQNGALVTPKTPSMPPIVSTYTVPATKYAILKFPSATGVSRDSLVSFLGGPDGMMQSAAFVYDANQGNPWGLRQILPGRYDFYLSRIDTFEGGKSGQGQEQGDHFCITFISSLKNIELNYDPLKANATAYLEFESGTLGMASFRGKVRGKSIFTQKDVDAISKGGLMKFLSYIPSVMLYDTDGQLKAWGVALPGMDRIMDWDERINSSSFTLEWLTNELENYPIGYRIERLPAGKYTAVFETPNYPPLMKKVTLTSELNTLDVNFDQNLIVGSSLTGVVKSTDGVVLPDVTIVLSHRTVEKTITTDAQGGFAVSGLPQGVYRMTLNKPGFALAAEKFGLGQDVKRFEGDDAILLSRANATIEGAVYSQKMPTPRVIVGARVVAYNETYNTQHPGKMLPVIASKTDEQGHFVLDGIIADNVYKVYVLAPGKLLEWKTLGTTQNPLVTGANTGVDFVLKSLAPRLKVTMGKIYENGRFLYKFFIESPKKIINPSNPTSLAAPYCRYSPVAGASAEFSASTAVEVLPTIGPEVTDADGGKTYSYSLKIPVVEDSEFYKLRIEATDGSVTYQEDILFGPKIEAKAKKDIKEELAQGGEISLDDTGVDATRLTVDPGSLTPTGAETSSIQQNGEEVPIGGFLSAMPNFNLSKTGSAKSAAMARIINSVVASDVYEVALGDAQLNRSLSLNLRFDMSKVTDTDLPNLSICQYNSRSDRWERVPGAVTVDPITGVVSVDVDSIENAASSSRATAPGRAIVKNGAYAVNRAAATSQSGVFAVFKQDPNTAKGFVGAEFAIYNFPNPFDLKSKNVVMQDANASTDQTVRGTMIKYSLPADKGGRVKLYIYNLAGELVRELDEGDRKGGYYYYTEWDGANDNGEECASGVYFLIAKSDGKKLNSKPLKLAILK